MKVRTERFRYDDAARKAEGSSAQAIINMSIGPSQSWSQKLGIPEDGHASLPEPRLGKTEEYRVVRKLRRSIVSIGQIAHMHKLSDKNPQKKLLKKYAEDYTASSILNRPFRRTRL